jgi:hypothetical protein
MSGLMRWHLGTIVIPLLAGLWLLIDRWGKQNTLHVLLLPLLFAVWRLLAMSRDMPRCRELDSYQPFKDAVGSWELLESFGLLSLTFFEASLGVIAEGRELRAYPPPFLSPSYPMSRWLGGPDADSSMPMN